MSPEKKGEVITAFIIHAALVMLAFWYTWKYLKEVVRDIRSYRSPLPWRGIFVSILMGAALALAFFASDPFGWKWNAEHRAWCEGERTTLQTKCEFSTYNAGQSTTPCKAYDPDGEWMKDCRKNRYHGWTGRGR